MTRDEKLLNRLEKRLIEVAGKKCKYKSRFCAICITWEAFAVIKEMLDIMQPDGWKDKK